MQTIMLGEHGPAVREVRHALQVIGLLPAGEAAPDPRAPSAAVYDGAVALAVRQFQQQRGLIAHGNVDDDTYRELMDARLRIGERVLQHTPNQRMQRGDDVRELQQRIAELGFDVGNIDGFFGPATAHGLSGFQRDMGLTPNGVADRDTYRALQQLGSKVVGGSAAYLRSRAARLRSGPALDGKTVVLDPAPSTNPAYTDASAEIVWDIAQRLQARLSVLGVHAPIPAQRSTAVSAADRADYANTIAADLYICINVATHSSPHAEGMATCYFGASEQTYSMPGQELAGLIHREVSARTPFVDLGLYGRTDENLRLTAMPAVRLEIGYLTNRTDAAYLREDHNREVVAEGIIAAVQRFYLDSPQDYQTGTWRLPPSLRLR